MFQCFQKELQVIGNRRKKKAALVQGEVLSKVGPAWLGAGAHGLLSGTPHRPELRWKTKGN